MKKFFCFLLLLLLPFSLVLAADNFSNPDDSSLLADTWTNGTSETIAWNSLISPAKLLLFRNTGNGNVFVKNVGTPTAGAKSFLWNVNVSTVGSGYKMAVCPTTATSPNYTGCIYSDSFTINGSASDTSTPNITPTLTASPSVVQPGGSATLSWNCTPKEKCYCSGSLTGGTGQLILPGSKTVSPSQTTTYTLQCRDKSISNSSYVSKTATLTIGAPSDMPKIVLKANDSDQDLTVAPGTSVNLSWQKVGGIGTNFTTCRLGSQPQDLAWDSAVAGVSGTKNVSPTATTNYSVICWDAVSTNYVDNLVVSLEGGSATVPPESVDYTKFACQKQKERINFFRYKYVYRCVEDATGNLNRTQCLANCDEVQGPNNDENQNVNCEKPFQQIVSSLSEGKSTKITEKSFESWIEDDSKDNFSLSDSKGSGDGQDIKEYMERFQKEQRLWPCDPSSITAGNGVSATCAAYFRKHLQFENLMASISSQLQKNIPVMVGISFTDPETQKPSGHEVLILKIKINDDQGRTTLTYFDSNIPGIATLDCGPSGKSYVKGYGFLTKVVCDATDRNGINYGTVILRSFANGITNPSCDNPIRTDPSGWLMENYPELENFSSISSPMGNCFGHSAFLKSVACYGDFVGKDYHPGDMVGDICNSDLTPRQSLGVVSALSNQLANIKQFVWSNSLKKLLGF